MKKTFSVKQRLIAAFLTLLMIATAFVGTTLAWFTDSVTSAGNTIISGNLKVDLLHKVNNDWVSIKENLDHKIFDYDKWEPGYTRVETLKIQNLGSLALKYRLSIETDKANEKRGKGGESLSDVIEVYLSYGESADTSFESIKGNSAWSYKGTLTEVMNNPSSFLAGELLPTGETLDQNVADTTKVGFEMVSIALHMKENAGNEYQDLRVGDIYVNLIATQWGSESDSFGSDYDKDALFPNLNISGITVDVTTANGIVTEAANVAGAGVAATIPAGVKVENGANKLGLSVTEKTQSDANISLNDGEALRSLDVHMAGVAKDNTVPMIITIEQAMKVGLNIGNYTLYHVENGASVAMTAVSSMAELNAHNEFYYDPATGNVTLAMATFSEVAMVAEKENAWEGNFDYTWYDASKTELVIANGDQLAAFGAIVGGMKKVIGKDSEGKNIYSEEVIQDSFKDKTIKLIADINLGDDEENNIAGKIFYPIGYWNNEGTYEKLPVEDRVTAVSSGFYTFNGTFDGNGHTISNIYQNTWEMKGDHDWYDTIKEQYYRDGMGIFGRVYKGTVKNLTVKNFSSDGEITTTGVIAAYADGATFENIAIFNCNPRVYNIGNGGIVGCVGWYAKEANLKTTFKNITVDNSNKISALWGSYDVACGGIVGQYYPTSGQTSANKPANGGIHFENCHVSAQMDVYNDVCANYQYYAYRYTGMLIGSVRENVTENGHSYPNMDGITADGCTVHFGDWNDYYYCEIVANSLASYTHDHQFSRLEQVASVDVENKTVTTLKGETVNIPVSGWAHYVVVKSKDGNGKWVHGDGTNYATCYHFNNGAVWNHADAGTETVGGVEVLKEDKQLVYLEFNNLVTGYGWGVTSKGVGDLAGVTILDREVGNSVVKFEGKVTELVNNKTFKLGDIFNLVDNGVELVPGALSVAVTNLDENNPVSATIVYDRENWENSTITFTGTGKVNITIQDYYFCTPTTIEVTIADRQPEEKFYVVMNNGDFLHRVGNSGTVALNKLFKAKDGVTVGTISVTVEAVDGTGASGTYSNNAIQFTGTGVVKVTIKDDDKYCTPTVLYLEVINAVNATGAMNATSNNVVLLNNAGFSSLEISGGYTFYGNGFTLTCGSDSVAVDRSYGFVVLENGTLDNVQIIVPNFDHAILFDANKAENGNPSQTDNGRTRYYNIRSAVVMTGNSKILNSYVSGGRAAVYVTKGDAHISNSTIVGGAAANIHVETAAKVTLNDITLIQKPIKANVHDTSKTLMGLSVVTICDSNGNGGAITLTGTFKQYAWARESYKQYVPSEGQSLVSSVLSKKDFVHEIEFDDGVISDAVNLGICYIPDGLMGGTNSDNLLDKRTATEKSNIPYDIVEISAAKIYTYKNINGTQVNKEPEYSANKQENILPDVVFKDTNADRLFSTYYDQSNGWTAVIKIDLDKGNYTFNFSNLLVQKYGKTLSYTVSLIDGTVVDANSDIVLNDTGSRVYKLKITDNLIYNHMAELTGKTEDQTYVLEIQTRKTSISGPEWYLKPTPSASVVKNIKKSSWSSEWSLAIPVLNGAVIKYWSKSAQNYVNLDLTTLTPTTNGEQANGANEWVVTVEGEYTLKITSSVFKTSHDGMPVVYEENGVKTLYYTVNNSNGCLGTSTTSRSITITYTFTDSNNNVLKDNVVWNINKSDMSTTTIIYDTFVAGGGSGSSSGGSSPCVTPDTLVTLADGTQKRIDQVTYTDKLLVWNFYTGKYDIASASILMNHGASTVNVTTLYFADGTSINTINGHGFFDVATNEFVLIDEFNVADYIGHSFVKQNGDGYSTTELVSYNVEEQYTEVWSILTAEHYNCMLEGMWTVTAAEVENSPEWLMPYEIGEDMKYDEASMEADIDEYGLYTYEDFAEYMTYEQFKALGLDNFKVSVGKGYITWDEILYLISIHITR